MDKHDKKFLYLLLFPVEFSLVLIAFIITLFIKKPFPSLFTGFAPPLALFIICICGAGLAGLVSLAGSKIRIFKEILDILIGFVRDYKLNLFDIFFISLTAAFCEEILFRAVLQPMWGIYITSFAFILLHGYFNPLNWKMSVFGLIMFCVSLIIGSIYIKYGLVPAMLFHFSYDLTALLIMKKPRA
jgi:uncharacterized protein